MIILVYLYILRRFSAKMSEFTKYYGWILNKDFGRIKELIYEILSSDEDFGLFLKTNPSERSKRILLEKVMAFINMGKSSYKLNIHEKWSICILPENKDELGYTYTVTNDKSAGISFNTVNIFTKYQRIAKECSLRIIKEDIAKEYYKFLLLKHTNIIIDILPQIVHNLAELHYHA